MTATLTRYHARMADWSTPEPRIVMSGRIRREVWEALDAFVEDAQQDGMPRLQRYHVLEHLLAPVLTEEGRAQLRRELRE